NEKDSSTTSNTDKDKKVNRTQLVFIKSSNVSSQVSLNNSLTYLHTICLRQPIIHFIWFMLCINLKTYINTNESDFQAAVLDLLVQLLLIRHFIYCTAEFLVMLSHDTLRSKRVIKIQNLIKHYD
ncbi:unnamed protein product, partial [Rotaria sp. Silwood1]